MFYGLFSQYKIDLFAKSFSFKHLLQYNFQQGTELQHEYVNC